MVFRCDVSIKLGLTVVTCSALCTQVGDNSQIECAVSMRLGIFLIYLKPVNGSQPEAG